MGYIQSHLMTGEKVVYEAKQHSIIYTGPFLIALLAFGAFLLPIEEMFIKIIICAVVLIAALWWAFSIYGGRQYVVTTHRLIFKRGIINRNSFELLLRKCEGCASVKAFRLTRLFLGACSTTAQSMSPQVRLPTDINTSAIR